MIFLAPLQGYSDFIFRNVYSRHYTGIDIAVSPFISLVHGKKINSHFAKDVFPANNHTMAVIPQILGSNTEHFIQMAEFLGKWDYTQLNWNLGCPVKNVARKKRGSGLLPYPELIREILEKVIPNIPQRLSVKLRLGLSDTNEIIKLIPVLNAFPLQNVIIHPRIGTQMYEGNIHHEVLQKCIPLLKHEIIYNGDIFTKADFDEIKCKYPTIQKWMIGRGVFYNPLLPLLMKGENAPFVEKANKQYLSFLLDLYNELQLYYSKENIIYKIKEFWKLFCKRFIDEKYVFNQISHVHSMNEIIRITKKITETEVMNNWS